MNLLSRELNTQIERCNSVIKNAKDRLKTTTANTLIISSSHNTTQFWFHEPKDRKRHYIKKKNYSVLGPLANKMYSKNVLSLSTKILNALLKSKEILEKAGALEKTLSYEAVWDAWPKELKSLTKVHAMSFEELARLWNQEKYSKLMMPIPKVHMTAKGEYVRSKSELIIADALFKNNIPYHYEQKLSFGKKEVFPDFTILNPRTREIVYLEHLGMLDEITYKNDATEKLLVYMENGHWVGRDLFITYESVSCPFHNEQIYDIIKNYLSVD